MNIAKDYINDFLHLFFPHLCVGCGTDVLNNEDVLCAKCINELPVTGFISTPNNPVEKIFYGRMDVQHAGSAFYFTKDSVIQQAIAQLKYKSNQPAGILLGKLLGCQIAESKRFDDVDCIIPIPLNDKKFYKRGYNQAEVIAKGIASIWHKPVIVDAVERILFTETQTHKNRVSRWETMAGVFTATQPETMADKHILLVDDVITTGATMEACGQALLKIPGIKLSIATIAYTI
jgi:ComF family protein